MEKKDLYEQLKSNPKNIRFDMLCRTAEKFGFIYRGGRGSHRIYVREGIR